MQFTKSLCMLLLLMFALSYTNAQSIEKTFTTSELQTDFKVFRNKYESMLANLYLYTPKPQLDKVFDSLYRHIHPMTSMEFYSYITPVSSVIKDGHSNIFPDKQITEYYNEHALFFPFTIYWNEERMFITMNLSADTAIHAGTEILSINGKNVKDIMDYLLARQVRDGNNENYALWILNNYFREYYSYHFGHPNTFTLGIHADDDSMEEVSVNALSKTTIADNKAVRYIAKKTDYFYTAPNTNAGIFTIKSWDDKKLKGQIDDVFTQLTSQKLNNLIIDVRNNQGGDFNPAIHLLSYLLKDPFQYFSDLKSVKGMSDTSLLLKTQTGKMLGIQKPAKNPFTGKLYILTNGGSFSNTASFCARVEYYKRGVFVGEETGGNKTVFSGEFGLKGATVLPNTRISCENANYRMVVTDISKNTGHGVTPNYLVVPDIHNIIENKDIVLDYALKLILKDK